MLISIVLGNSLNNVKNNAFYNCSRIEELHFPSQLETIGEYAFSNCDLLKRIEFNDNLLSIGSYAFYNLTNLDNIVNTNRIQCILFL